MYIMTDEHKKRIGESVSKARQGKPLSESHKAALKGSHSNRKRVACQHCGEEYSVNVIKRHEKSCK